ncbi:MAG: VWA domain-containing protein [Proteobacteria bacterium]|nr:VWA domain-containing protein [Pseudomonadota bacterium]
MAYTADISRTNPSCFLFLIDRSGSMEDTFGSDPKRRKADGVADAINRLLQTLTIRCAKAEGVRDYYYVGVIGYGDIIDSAFTGALSGKELVPLSEVAMNPARIETRTKKVEDGAGGLVEQSIKFPTWFAPIANGGTPMCQALKLAQSIIQKWLSQHPDCFPPIIMNITDGEATDGNPIIPAEALTRLSNNDGNVLLFNLHISSHQANPIMFPDSEGILPDEFARILFGMSSNFPTHLINAAQQEGFQVSENTRGFVFNADITSVIQFLDIGTRPSNLR